MGEVTEQVVEDTEQAKLQPHGQGVLTCIYNGLIKLTSFSFFLIFHRNPWVFFVVTLLKVSWEPTGFFYPLLALLKTV